MDVEATTAVRQAEVTAQRIMLDRTQERFGIWPERLAADTGYGSAENLAWLVHERGIEPHIPVFEKSDRSDGSFADPTSPMITSTTAISAPAARNCGSSTGLRHARSGLKGWFMRYRASKRDCDACTSAAMLPRQPARKIPRSIHEGARDMARDLLRPTPISSHDANGKRWRCCSRTSNASSNWIAYALEAQTEQKTSSFSPPPPRTSARWRSSFRARTRRQRIAAGATTRRIACERPLLSNADFFNTIGQNRTIICSGRMTNMVKLSALSNPARVASGVFRPSSQSPVLARHSSRS